MYTIPFQSNFQAASLVKFSLKGEADAVSMAKGALIDLVVNPPSDTRLVPIRRDNVYCNELQQTSSGKIGNNEYISWYGAGFIDFYKAIGKAGGTDLSWDIKNYYRLGGVGDTSKDISFNKLINETAIDTTLVGTGTKKPLDYPEMYREVNSTLTKPTIKLVNVQPTYTEIAVDNLEKFGSSVKYTCQIYAPSSDTYNTYIDAKPDECFFIGNNTFKVASTLMNTSRTIRIKATRVKTGFENSNLFPDTLVTNSSNLITLAPYDLKSPLLKETVNPAGSYKATIPLEGFVYSCVLAPAYNISGDQIALSPSNYYKPDSSICQVEKTIDNNLSVVISPGVTGRYLAVKAVKTIIQNGSPVEQVTYSNGVLLPGLPPAPPTNIEYHLAYADKWNGADFTYFGIGKLEVSTTILKPGGAIVLKSSDFDKTSHISLRIAASSTFTTEIYVDDGTLSKSRCKIGAGFIDQYCTGTFASQIDINNKNVPRIIAFPPGDQLK